MSLPFTPEHSYYCCICINHKMRESASHYDLQGRKTFMACLVNREDVDSGAVRDPERSLSLWTRWFRQGLELMGTGARASHLPSSLSVACFPRNFA